MGEVYSNKLSNLPGVIFLAQIGFPAFNKGAQSVSGHKDACFFRGINNIYQEPSMFRPNSEYHKFLNP